jgi:hypothetical protein
MAAPAHDLVLALPDALVDELAERVAARLARPAAEPWVGVDAVAAHLGCRRQHIYDLVSQRGRRAAASRTARTAPGCCSDSPRSTHGSHTAPMRHLRLVSTPPKEIEMAKTATTLVRTDTPGVYKRGIAGAIDSRLNGAGQRMASSCQERCSTKWECQWVGFGL